MKNNYWLIMVFILFCLITGGCEKAAKNEETAKIEEGINLLYPDFSKTEIDLDDTEIQEISPDYSIKLVNATNQNYVKKIENCIVINDTIYVTDSRQNAIVLVYGNNILGTIGRIGAGPLEFSTPTLIEKNKERIAVLDQQNGRVQLMNHQFHYLTSYPATFASFIGEIRFFKDRIYFSAETNSRYLLRSYNIREPYDEKKVRIPNLTYKGKFVRYSDFNKFTIMGNGDIVISYTSAPYLFRYDSTYNLQEIIELEGKEIIHLGEEPEMPGAKRMITRGVTSYQNYIFFTTNHYVYVFKREASRTSLVNKLNLHDISHSSLTIQNGAIYLTNIKDYSVSKYSLTKIRL